MYSLSTLLYAVLLFVLLTPGILLTIPPKGSPLVVAVVHGIVFAVVMYFTQRMAYRIGRQLGLEGFSTAVPPSGTAAGPKKEKFRG
jgi:hypothetical protein